LADEISVGSQYRTWQTDRHDIAGVEGAELIRTGCVADEELARLDPGSAVVLRHHHAASLVQHDLQQVGVGRGDRACFTGDVMRRAAYTGHRQRTDTAGLHARPEATVRQRPHT
jgi:hypothetical protein